MKREALWEREIKNDLMYASVHIAVHKRKVPSLFKTQYRHHALHHYKYPGKAFGVSTTLWDRVFGEQCLLNSSGQLTVSSGFFSLPDKLDFEN